MSEHWPGPRVTVVTPSEPQTFYRLVHSRDVSHDDLRSPFEVGERRFSGEDQCSFRGISVWETKDQAALHGADINERRRLVGQALYTHIVAVRISPRKRHACARTGGSKGHHTVWGRFDELRSRVVRAYSIQGDER